MCGDSTNEKDVDELMGKSKISLIATDPPYLVGYTGQGHPTTKSNKGWDEYKDEKTSIDFYSSFLRCAIKHARKGVAIYQWYAFWNQRLVEDAWEQHKLLLHQQIIWVKSRKVLTRSDYMWQSELCCYGWIKGNRPERKPPPDQSNVWQIASINETNLHPTEKPPELFRRPMIYHLRASDISYDPFIGSGASIVAAEQLNRVCYGMEIHPPYVAVTLERMSEMGLKPKLVK